MVHIGDETDKHGLNFHGQDPDLPSAGDELEKARTTIHEIEKLWSNVDLYTPIMDHLHTAELSKQDYPEHICVGTTKY